MINYSREKSEVMERVKDINHPKSGKVRSWCISKRYHPVENELSIRKE
jgi:hypothetical protein